MIRVVVVDDHALVREGLRNILDRRPGVEVLGEAATGTDAVALAAALEPDVMVIDLHMPGLNGIDATRAIVAANPRIAVLVLTMLEDDSSVTGALAAGARGYVLKGASQADLGQAVESVARGEAVLGAGVADRVLAVAGGGRALVDPLAALSPREREILALVADGATNGAIARRLAISDKTVRNHVSNLLTKLGVQDRTQAALLARRTPGPSPGPLADPDP